MADHPWQKAMGRAENLEAVGPRHPHQGDPAARRNPHSQRGGADAAMMTTAPIRAALCKMLIETRLRCIVTRAKPRAFKR